MIKLYNIVENQYKEHSVPSQANAYKIGAERLVKIFLKNPTYNTDLVYAILHLYQVFVEWRLKEAIRTLHIALLVGDEFPAYRRLDLLWKKFAELAEKANLNTNDVSFLKSQEVVMQLSELEKAALLATFGQIDIVMEVDVIVLAQTMSEMDTYLSTIENNITIFGLPNSIELPLNS
ncbi:MAG: hypothetical protein SFU27_11770 [Thermonemataceae bacterium]|nr:hypothetical protein [Thermonemataceae bacterium]